MKAFHGKKSVKEKYLARVKAHALADEIVRGRYWENGKGCAVGCTIHSADHSAYEIELGIPEWLARVEDKLFEGMPLNQAKKWPTQFLSTIKVGSNLEAVKNPFLVVILKFSLKQFDHKKYPRSVAAIKDVIKLLKPKTLVSLEQWQAARKNASYATYAAYAAAYAATYAAYAATDAATYSDYAAYASYVATYAANAATYSAGAADAARSSAYSYFAKELLKLLEKCK